MLMHSRKAASDLFATPPWSALPLCSMPLPIFRPSNQGSLMLECKRLTVCMACHAVRHGSCRSTQKQQMGTSHPLLRRSEPPSRQRPRDDPRGVAALEQFKRQRAELAAAQAARAAAGGRFAPHQPRQPQVGNPLHSCDFLSLPALHDRFCIAATVMSSCRPVQRVQLTPLRGKCHSLSMHTAVASCVGLSMFLGTSLCCSCMERQSVWLG